jgi:hypothetical protein
MAGIAWITSLRGNTAVLLIAWAACHAKEPKSITVLQGSEVSRNYEDEHHYFKRMGRYRGVQSGLNCNYYTE